MEQTPVQNGASLTNGHHPRVDFNSFKNVINGELRGGDKVYHGINPATEEQLWPVPVATEKDLEDAVTAAERAYKTWSKTPIKKRKEAIAAYANALKDYENDLKEVVLKETGKPTMNAEREAAGPRFQLMSHLNYDIPLHVTSDDDKQKVYTTYQALGIVGAICPWNFPLILAMNKIGPAILTGNTIIVKPSPFTPYSTLKLIEIAQPHFPPGVIQALGGSDQLGPWIVDHPKIPKIAFTGSTATGIKIQERAARQLKRVTLELGGNDAAIVFPDVDISSAASGLARGALHNTGQICFAIKRVYVHSSIYDDFLPALAEAVEKMSVGDPSAPNTLIGPIQNKMQFDKVSSLREESLKAGHTFILGEKHSAHGPVEGKGYFVTPAILSKPPPSSALVVSEQFGPLIPVQSWDSLDDVIAQANNTTYGLGASVWTRDIEKAEEVALRLEAGNVWINQHAMPAPHAFIPGSKHSGIGGEGGSLALMGYLQPKTVYVPKTGAAKL